MTSLRSDFKVDVKEYYSVGEVSKICGISKKALRFYDRLNIICPDKVSDNGYRYYSKDSLLIVPIIKYYKQMGFKLEEMKEFVEGSTYVALERMFREKIKELKNEESEIYMKYVSVQDWYDLILEAEAVIESTVNDVAVKYVESSDYCYLEQPYSNNLMEVIIHIEFTNYIESINNKITGPVMIMHPSIEDRIKVKVNQ